MQVAVAEVVDRTCMDMHVDMCIGMFTDMYIDMCIFALTNGHTLSTPILMHR